jgi:hypothetical protein
MSMSSASSCTEIEEQNVMAEPWTEKALEDPAGPLADPGPAVSIPHSVKKQAVYCKNRPNNRFTESLSKALKDSPIFYKNGFYPHIRASNVSITAYIILTVYIVDSFRVSSVTL